MSVQPTKFVMPISATEVECTGLADYFDRRGILGESGRTEDGRYYVVAMFKDELDVLAFMVASGLATLEPLPVQPGEQP